MFNSSSECQAIRSFNGKIVSDSDSSLDYEQPSSIKELVMKKIKAVRRKGETELVAEKRFLQRNVSKRTNTIINQCPGIGSTIEEYVKDHNIGADAWHRTGILTFDGKCRLAEKVTYKKIQSYLENVYSRKFSYGTVVELCVARNKRRKSSKLRLLLGELERDLICGIILMHTGVVHFIKASTR